MCASSTINTVLTLESKVNPHAYFNTLNNKVRKVIGLFIDLAMYAVMLVVITLAAFALARLEFRGKNLVFTLFLSGKRPRRE